MIERFHNDDPGYKRWRKRHGAGYVFNHVGGSDLRMNVLHRADCEQLLPKRSDQAWTSYAKFCSDDRSELEVKADELRGGRDRWTTCDSCLR